MTKGERRKMARQYFDCFGEDLGFSIRRQAFFRAKLKLFFVVETCFMSIGFVMAL